MTKTSRCPYTLEDYKSQRAFDHDLPAATTERPVAIRGGHTTRLFFVDGPDLPRVVIAAMRTDAVRRFGFLALRAQPGRRRAQ